MKFSKKATGVEIIPNSSFWVSIPSNIKVIDFFFYILIFYYVLHLLNFFIFVLFQNGFSFTVSKIRRGGSYTPI